MPAGRRPSNARWIGPMSNDRERFGRRLRYRPTTWRGTPDVNNTQPLSPTGRSEALARLAGEELDVLVIGGGVVGAGCALDAVTRGLTVGLVEARDFAAGTSSRSSKLFHGGLRYLEQFNFALVFEALKERSLVLNTLCPHLARPVPFIYPLEKITDRGYVGLGIGVYDVMGAGRGVPAHLRHLGRKKTMESFPLSLI